MTMIYIQKKGFYWHNVQNYLEWVYWVIHDHDSNEGILLVQYACLLASILWVIHDHDTHLKEGFVLLQHIRVLASILGVIHDHDLHSKEGFLLLHA